MVPHSRVASVLAEADVFLNTALTEAFCIAIGKVLFTFGDFYQF